MRYDERYVLSSYIVSYKIHFVPPHGPCKQRTIFHVQFVTRDLILLPVAYQLRRIASISRYCGLFISNTQGFDPLRIRAGCDPSSVKQRICSQPPSSIRSLLYQITILVLTTIHFSRRGIYSGSPNHHPTWDQRATLSSLSRQPRKISPPS